MKKEKELRTEKKVKWSERKSSKEEFTGLDLELLFFGDENVLMSMYALMFQWLVPQVLLELVLQL